MSDLENSPQNDRKSEQFEDVEENGSNHERNKADSIGDLDSRKDGDEDNNDNISDDFGKDLNAGSDEEENLGEISYDKPSKERRSKGTRAGAEKVSKLRKKVKKNDESDGENKDYDLSDNESIASDKPIKELEPKKGKRAKNKIDDAVVEKECAALLLEMEEAYERDKICNKQKQPAVYKLQSIKKVASDLRKPQLQERFLNSGGLDTISKWLEKMPDGSPPGQTLKKKLIELINILPIDYEHINTTVLGKQLYQLSKNPKEDTELKKEIKNIVAKWYRIALMIPVDYRYPDEIEEDRVNKKKDMNFSLDDRGDSSKQEKIKNIFKNPLKPYERKDLNKRVGYNYSVKPKGIDEKDFKAKSSGGQDFDKMFSDYKRRKKKI